MKYNIDAASCNSENRNELIEKYPKLRDFNYSIIERQVYGHILYDSYIEITTLDELNRLLSYVENVVISKSEGGRANYTIVIYDGCIE